MALSVVVEIEDGSFACTVATVTRRAIAISACLRMSMAEPTAANIANCLRAAQAQLGQFESAHVIIGDRRIGHFVVKVPRLPVAELVALLHREALRLCGLPPGTALGGHARVLGRTDDGMQRVGCVAAPTSLLEPIERGFADAGVAVADISSVESSIAGILDTRAARRTAVVDVGGGRARFLVYENGTLSHMRRFLLHGAASDAGSQALLLGQLAMELPRTLELLREQGCEIPNELIVGSQVANGEDLVSLTDGAIESVRSHTPTAGVADGEEAPSLAIFGRLNLLQAGRTPPLLSGGLTVTMPVRPLWAAAWATAASVAVAGIALGISGQGDLDRMGQQLREVEQARDHLQAQLAAHSSAAPAVETADPDTERERDILAERRPISMALARISALTRAYIGLESLVFADGDRLEVAGTSEAPDRLSALRAIGDFGESLDSVPFLLRAGAEELHDDAQVQNRIHFRFALTWRRP